MSDTPHAANEQKHSSPETKHTRFHNLWESVKSSWELSFALSPVIIVIFILACISLFVFLFLPSLLGQQEDILGFWRKATGDGSGPDVSGVLLDLAALQVTLFALTVFRESYSTGKTQPDSCKEHNRYDEYNSRHLTDAIQKVTICLAIASQALLTMETPRLIDTMKPIPGWTLALVFFLVNVIAMLSVCDFAHGVETAYRDAKRKNETYDGWESKNREKVPASQHPRIRATLPSFVLAFTYFILTFWPAIYKSWKWYPVRATICLSIASVVFALLMAVTYTALLLPWYLETGNSNKPCTGAAATVAVTLLIFHLCLNVSIGFSGLGAQPYTRRTQIAAFLIIALNIGCLLFARPHKLTFPYLMMVCDNEIKKQNRISDSANSAMAQWGNGRADSEARQA